ncbi:MAG: hypothetical protein AVDCRST_MAG73-156 [uncultured Thermomicrobiales bacterium]|uniref:Pyridoxamine 5'-phosphate oxidase N-terminal domain-containing protein n=1 Tax=uncultured Thermomicrobiales bacterium TaxID=1645740 RepID=A0A6J4TEJ3_9BACT|nr:MAG: hypothetical protein AVDCRST_MAG73-156 [uncultured Thermomicrobiales bacterium]
MPRSLTEPERQAFLAEPRLGVLSVAADDGRPPTIVPVWHHYEPGGDLSFYSHARGRKTGLIERAGAVSFVVKDDAPPYKYVAVEGSLVRTDRPPSADQLAAIARRYLPEDQVQGYVAAELENDLVVYAIRPDRWLSADFGDEDA